MQPDHRPSSEDSISSQPTALASRANPPAVALPATPDTSRTLSSQDTAGGAGSPSSGAPSLDIERKVFAERFDLLEELGSGGMGRVLRAFDRKLQRAVAVKRIKGPLATDPDLLRRFLREAQFAAPVEFCNKLSDREELSPCYSLQNIVRDGGAIKSADVIAQGGTGYRLPTEAEWEYAARAGTVTAFHFGNVNHGKEANIDGNYPFGTKTKGPYLQRTSVIDSYPANGFTLRDVCGNVWEWCSDGYDENFYGQTSGVVVDPECLSSDRRVLRGGSWSSFAGYSRSALRFRGAPDFRNYVLGFRVSRTQ